MHCKCEVWIVNYSCFLCSNIDLSKIKAFSVFSFVVALLAIAGSGIWFVIAASSTPSSSYALTCEWPKPNSDPVQLQVRQIKTELGVEEISDKLKTSVEQVEKALIAGDKCKDPELHDKMNMVGTTVRKIKEKVQEVCDSFNTGAKTVLIDLKIMWDFAVDGKKDKAVLRVKNVCETTEVLAEQVDALKGSVHKKGNEIHHALMALESYLQKEVDNHESYQRKLQEYKLYYLEKLNCATSLAREAEDKASTAAANAQREMKAWEELKAKNAPYICDDQHPFKKRWDEFLKDQQTFEAEAEESRRVMEQTQLKITTLEKDNETEDAAFTCISDAVTKMKEAAGRVPMPIMSVSLFEESLKKRCTDLHDETETISGLAVPKDTVLSQVCGKAKKLFAKWQALSKVSLDYFLFGDV